MVAANAARDRQRAVIPAGPEAPGPDDNNVAPVVPGLANFDAARPALWLTNAARGGPAARGPPAVHDQRRAVLPVIPDVL